MKITTSVIEKLLGILKDGIQHGAGDMDGPGNFCVQQAVSHAIGHDEYSDHPICVNDVVRSFGIHLNDRQWSPQDRAKGLKRFAVAQLGSNIIDSYDFNKIVADKWNAKYGTSFSTAHHLVQSLSLKSHLVEAAEIAVEALIELKSPGTEFLYMCDDPKPKAEHQGIVDRMKVRQLTWGNYNAGTQTSQTCAAGNRS